MQYWGFCFYEFHWYPLLPPLSPPSLLPPSLQGESCAAIGYKLELGGMTMRGRVDSHGMCVYVRDN